MSEAMLKKIFEQVQKNSSLITGVKSEITGVNKRLDSHYTLLKTLESRTDKLDIMKVCTNLYRNIN